MDRVVEVAAVVAGATVAVLFGQVPAWVSDLTAICGLVLAMAGVGALMLRLFTSRVREVVREETAPIARHVGYQLTKNGGESLVDRVQKIEQAVCGRED